jgi:predicted MFS family arabinose efflux permease
MGSLAASMCPDEYNEQRTDAKPLPDGPVLPWRLSRLARPAHNRPMTSPADPNRPVRRTWRTMPRTVVALGFVSLLMDTSSELIHSLLPVFLVSVLGASTITVGLIEGIGEATAAIAKVFSGVLSDRLGKRKLLTAIGYGVAAATKPVFPLAETAGAVLVVTRLVGSATRRAICASSSERPTKGVAAGGRLERRIEARRRS